MNGVNKFFPDAVTFYNILIETWPKVGNHLMTIYNETSIVLYLRVPSLSIAKNIIKTQSFVHSLHFQLIDWKFTSNLLEIIHENSTKFRDESRILYLSINRGRFEYIMKLATVEFNPPIATQTVSSCYYANGDDVLKPHASIEWIPEKDPEGKVLERRYMRIHLGKTILEDFLFDGTDYIEDITGFVKRQERAIKAKDFDSFCHPDVRPYKFYDEEVAKHIQITNKDNVDFQEVVKALEGDPLNEKIDYYFKYKF